MILSQLKQAREQNRKQIALLIDPDITDHAQLSHLLEIAKLSEVDYLFYGGSLITKDRFEPGLKLIREQSNLSVILFPGNAFQVSNHADAILYLSLISGRNPEFLIGQQVQAAHAIENSGLEIMPTGYLLIEGGRLTTAHYMSNTLPIPANKPEVAVSTALAGKQLGLQMIYLDAGSGAKYPISANMISAVNQKVNLPLIVGGGLRTTADVRNALTAGADVVVVGTAAEKNPESFMELADEVKSFVCR